MGVWKFGRLGRANREDAAGEALADEVVGFAREVEGEAGREERAEGLPGDAGEVHRDRVVGEPRAADARQKRGRKLRADGAVGVANGAREADGARRRAPGKPRLFQFVEGGDELVAVVGVEDVGVGAGREARRVAGLAVEEAREVEGAGDWREQVGAADGLVERLEAERGEAGG